MSKERFEERLFRVLGEAGYPPIKIFTLTPEEMCKIPHITVPNIRTILCIQNEIIDDKNLKVREERIRQMLKEAANERFD